MVESLTSRRSLRAGLAILAGVLILAVLAPNPSSAHFRLPGGHKCGFTLEFGPSPGNPRAYDAKVKRMSCSGARRAIRRFVNQRDSGFDCRGRAKPNGDRRSSLAHTDHKCLDGRKRMVFAVST